MDLIFRRKDVYTVHAPMSEVEYRLRYIINRRFDDFSIDLIGWFNSHGFQLTHKWGLLESRWLEDRPAYMNGHLLDGNDATRIEVRTRPSKVFVLLFYIFLFFFAWELSGMRPFLQLPLPWKAALLILPVILLFSIMQRSTYRLKRRFEELMQI